MCSHYSVFFTGWEAAEHNIADFSFRAPKQAWRWYHHTQLPPTTNTIIYIQIYNTNIKGNDGSWLQNLSLHQVIAVHGSCWSNHRQKNPKLSETQNTLQTDSPVLSMFPLKVIYKLDKCFPHCMSHTQETCCSYWVHQYSLLLINFGNLYGSEHYWAPSKYIFYHTICSNDCWPIWQRGIVLLPADRSLYMQPNPILMCFQLMCSTALYNIGRIADYWLCQWSAWR